MTDRVVQYNSQRSLFMWVIVSLLITTLAGYFVALWHLPLLETNIVSIVLWFFLLTFGLSLLDFYLGWTFKRSTLEYTPPTWEFSQVQLKVEDAKNLSREYNRKFFRLVAVPNYWYYFLPIVLIITSVTLPLYSLYVDSSIEIYIPLAFAVLLTLTNIVSLWGSWRSTSNMSSGDFALPLIREALKLAVIQSQVTGISHTRVILDKAEIKGFEIYRNPRVVSRITSIEEDAYIESSAEELGSVTKVLIRSYPKDNTPEIIWWWSSTDRNFRKYVGDNKEGYYVKNPVPSRFSELGLKDVNLIFANAVAMLVLERMRLLGPSEDLNSIISELGIDVQ
jgi:hypothetical protein